MVTEGSGKHRKSRAERIRVLTPEMRVRLSEFEFGLQVKSKCGEKQYLELGTCYREI